MIAITTIPAIISVELVVSFIVHLQFVLEMDDDHAEKVPELSEIILSFYKSPKAFDFGLHSLSLAKPHAGQQIILTDELMIHCCAKMKDNQREQYVCNSPVKKPLRIHEQVFRHGAVAG